MNKMKQLRKSDDLCELVEKIGYRQQPYQLQCNNGSFVSSLLYFFDDNPGAMEVLAEWIEDNYADELEEECEEDDEEIQVDDE